MPKIQEQINLVKEIMRISQKEPLKEGNHQNSS